MLFGQEPSFALSSSFLVLLIELGRKSYIGSWGQTLGMRLFGLWVRTCQPPGPTSRQGRKIKIHNSIIWIWGRFHRGGRGRIQTGRSFPQGGRAHRQGGAKRKGEGGGGSGVRGDAEQRLPRKQKKQNSKGPSRSARDITHPLINESKTSPPIPCIVFREEPHAYDPRSI